MQALKHGWCMNCSTQPGVPAQSHADLWYHVCPRQITIVLLKTCNRRMLQPMSMCSLHDKFFACSLESFKLLQATAYCSEPATVPECFCILS